MDKKQFKKESQRFAARLKPKFKDYWLLCIEESKELYGESHTAYLEALNRFDNLIENTLN